MKIFRIFSIIIVGLLLFPMVNSFGDQGDNDVIVDNSGSTNFSGYRIIIKPSGQINILPHGRMRANLVYSKGDYTVPSQSALKLISDLEAVMPLSGLKSPRCMKSVSFGTRTFVTYKGQTSSDIQCMKTEEFVKDINTIMTTISKAQNDVKIP